VNAAADDAVPAPARGPRQPLRRSAADMVRSMAVIVAIVVGLVLLVPRPNEVVQPDVNVASAAAGARPGLSFEPSVPEGLPSGWSAKTATARRGTDGVITWRLNYVTPSKRFAGVSQAAAPTGAWEDRQVTDGREQGTREVAGLQWVVRSRTDRGITSWVLRQPGLTTIVTGTASEQELTALATSLRLPPRPSAG
jgi:hypothetical protein